MTFKNIPTMATQAEKLSVSAQAKLRAAERIKAGAVGSDGPIRVNVTPASFKGKDGSVVAGVRVGRHFLVPEHVDALLEHLGIDPETLGERYLSLFS